MHIQSGSEDKHSRLSLGKNKKRIFSSKDVRLINVDKNGIHAHCEQFQVNDRTGSKLVATDSSKIHVYTDDLSIHSSTTKQYSSTSLVFSLA